jgi:hypothetical protein
MHCPLAQVFSWSPQDQHENAPMTHRINQLGVVAADGPGRLSPRIMQ